ncbi:MAG: hypothetical protein Kow0099_17400 [Candidatus Abyssubacteria bacterium]
MIGLQQYLYDGLDLLAEVSAVGHLQAGYTHGPGIDDPLIVRYSNANYYYHKNHQGSVTEITSENHGIVKTYEYDAYGNILQETGPSLTGGFTYTARELHTRSGLYYYRARFYDLRTGRFLTQDPIGFLGGVNLYAYVGNDSVNWVDPLRLVTLQLGGGITYSPKRGILKPFGYTYGHGLIGSYHEGVFQLGRYKVSGYGLYVGHGGAAMLDVTWSNNHCIKAIDGPAATGGGSINVRKALSLGGEVNLMEAGSPAYTVSGALGFGSRAEGHLFKTTTTVYPWLTFDSRIHNLELIAASEDIFNLGDESFDFDFVISD